MPGLTLYNNPAMRCPECHGIKANKGDYVCKNCAESYLGKWRICDFNVIKNIRSKNPKNVRTTRRKCGRGY